MYYFSGFVARRMVTTITSSRKRARYTRVKPFPGAGALKGSRVEAI